MTEYQLKNGKVIELWYLSRAELDTLLEIATTPVQAEQIKERCEALLNLWEAKEDGVVDIGCPHCTFVLDGGGYQCAGCAYAVLDSTPSYYELHCVGVPFACLTLGDISGLAFLHDQAKVDLFDADYVPSPEEVDNGREFLNGHIEWANAVLLQAQE